MFLRATSLSVFAVALACVPCASSQHTETAQRADVVHYTGTVGQQRVVMSLQVAEDDVTGHYAYDTQKSEIRFIDSRVFGATVVLQDEDGNILHLHFESARGEKTGEWKNAAMLEGTLDRGEMDLPVKLTRAVDGR